MVIGRTKSDNTFPRLLLTFLEHISVFVTASGRVSSCEIIEKEAIPNATYIKETQKKGNVEHKRFPVLPSNHFGLRSKFDFV